MDNKDIQMDIQFPKTINPNKWAEYLKRDLEISEKMILRNFHCEINMNQKIGNIYGRYKEKKIYCPKLSDLYGNCLFESLIYHKIGENVNSLRLGLAKIMYKFKDYKNFFNSRPETLEEIFNETNEIELVYKKTQDDRIYYKYNYDAMIQDLSCDNSWGKLPTHLLLMVISLLYHIKIIIINNVNDYNICINAYENDESKIKKTIYIGHIIEYHYIPLDINDDSEIKYLFYEEAKNNFFNWANRMQEEQNKNSENSENPAEEA